jgi:glycosyltransferase involved in cell wall biosynthesis
VTHPEKTHWKLLVVVPAHDEVELISRCLESVRGAVQRAAAHGHLAHVVVVADACTDGTAHLARCLLGGWGEVLEVSEQNVGRARAQGVRRGMERLGGQPGSQVWIANTDADTAVPECWLTRQLTWASMGFVAVAGTVRVDSFAAHSPGLQERFENSYASAISAGQPHIHGANLGIRADAYVAIAGWPPVVLAEDHGLWNRLRAAGLQARSDPELVVVTSGRSVGRAPGGFADTLSALARAPATAPAPAPVTATATITGGGG